jgi:hypothetical protein
MFQLYTTAQCHASGLAFSFSSRKSSGLVNVIVVNRDLATNMLVHYKRIQEEESSSWMWSPDGKLFLKKPYVRTHNSRGSQVWDSPNASGEIAP